MTTGIVYDLEPVQVQIAQRVLRHAGCSLRRQPRQALLELPPPEQAGKGVVSGLVVEFAGYAPPLGHIVEDQHHSDLGPVAVAEEGRRVPDRDFRPVAAHQERSVVHVHGAPFAQTARGDAL